MMKIVKKPKIPVQVCTKCGCVIQIKTKDLTLDYAGETKTYFKCPICWTKNAVKFNETKEYGDNVDRCISCGEVIPEGRQVCLKCEDWEGK